MPRQPPRFRLGRAAPVAKGWKTSIGKSRHDRGYGSDHVRMRKIVLEEEPFCRLCREQGIVSLTKVADHIIPKAEGGGNERSNYQGLCEACSKAKTAAESRAGRIGP